MQFKDIPVGAEFLSADARYRKCSEKKAHLVEGREGAGPLRFRPDAEVTEPAKAEVPPAVAKPKSEPAKSEPAKPGK